MYRTYKYLHLVNGWRHPTFVQSRPDLQSVNYLSTNVCGVFVRQDRPISEKCLLVSRPWIQQRCWLEGYSQYIYKQVLAEYVVKDRMGKLIRVEMEFDYQ